VDEEEVLEFFRIGALGSLYGMQACFPHMKDRGGRIVNVGSAVGVEGTSGFLAYAMEKEAIRALTKVAAREWGRYGITVNTICPSAMTPAIEQVKDTQPAIFNERVGRIVLGRLGDPEADIGRAVVALVGPDMGYLTAATLMIDGGKCILGG
jgi:NAD(P)-dependent dehydrogenase (short-subunit alcohol dehydrogenase family)